jgi:uncharacterized protein GlcG (DUF336 family)
MRPWPRAEAQGRHIAVTVLDRGGNIVTVQRADGVGPHNTAASGRKAYTALSTKNDTQALAVAARGNPDMANLTTVPELLLLGGGLPLRAKGDIVGAIGVAGGGGAQRTAPAPWPPWPPCPNSISPNQSNDNELSEQNRCPWPSPACPAGPGRQSIERAHPRPAERPADGRRDGDAGAKKGEAGNSWAAP